MRLGHPVLRMVRQYEGQAQVSFHLCTSTTGELLRRGPESREDCAYLSLGALGEQMLIRQAVLQP